MHDSADIKSAHAELDKAVDSLEAGLGDLMTRMRALETGAQDSDAFREDRTKLAAQLDEMAAKAEAAAEEARAATEKLSAREAEFKTLARDSEAELEQIMTVVRGALNASSGA